MSRKDAALNMKQILVERRDALRRALAGDLNSLKEFRGQLPGDIGDNVLDSVQDEIGSQLAEVESLELSRIEYALEHIGKGQFGVCDECGTDIPAARLNALPSATLCIDCQRKSERQSEDPSSTSDDWSYLLGLQEDEAEMPPDVTKLESL
jgi:DnaK suppressor protein